MDKALGALGTERAMGGETLNRFIYNGPNAHLIIYPVANNRFLNVLFVISDPNPWHTEDGRHIAPGTKADAIRAYADWHPHVRDLVDLLPDELQKWAIFDLFEHPLQRYYHGSVAVAGDAAHAAGPHLGSGAGFGIEDALVLASILESADTKLKSTNRNAKVELCRAALIAYNSVRYDRTQWLIGATREACALFHWQDEAVGSDFDKFLPEISKRFHTIWDNDIHKMVQGAIKEFEEVLVSKPNIQTSLLN